MVKQKYLNMLPFFECKNNKNKVEILLKLVITALLAINYAKPFKFCFTHNG